MARRRKRRKRGFGTQTAFKFIRIASLLAPAAYEVMQGGRPQDMARRIMAKYGGFDIATGEFRPEGLLQGYGPFLATVLATYGIPKLAGMIRRL